MIFRPYQDRAITRAKNALIKHGNTLIVAPTGAGKTYMLSGLTGRINPQKALILQHRDELVDQNLSKFNKINPKYFLSRFDSTEKSWRGQAVFAMVQTLSRKKNLDTIGKVDLVIVDECQHVAANSYLSIINTLKDKNPNIMIAGFTATPMRADKKGLRAVFNNCADKITIKELIDLGFLVTPEAYVIDVGTQEELSHVKKIANDFDPGQIEKIMNKRPINAEVVRQWKKYAGNRKTIIFCSTLKHAADVATEFKNSGIAAETIDGLTPKRKRKTLLRQFKTNQFQVLVNVGVLVEGFDEPTVSCIVLLRPCSFKSTMIQMIGRGLRIVNSKDYPGVTKINCVVLDFGTSLLTHGDIDAEVDLGRDKSNDEKKGGEAPTKICPEKNNSTTPYMLPDVNETFGCGAEVPAGCIECPFCGFIFARPGGDDIMDAIALTEIDLLNRSPFRWIDLFGSGKVIIASGFGSFSMVASTDGKLWHVIGKEPNVRILTHIGVFGKAQAIAVADDFLRQNEDSLSCNKARKWMTDPATFRQGELLRAKGYDVKIGLFGCENFTKLTATAHLNFAWNREQIERLLNVAA